MSVTIDLREFNQALKQYAVAGKKTIAEATNKKMESLMINAAEFTPVGSKSNIPEPGQFALVAYWLGGGYTRKQAAAFEKRMLMRRRQAVRFLRSFFVRGKLALLGKLSASKGVYAYAKRATANNQNIMIESGYEYKNPKSRRWTDPDKDAAKAERILKRALDKSIAFNIKDMEVYIQGKLGNTAAKYSALQARNAIRGA
jgi:hypothetical protein